MSETILIALIAFSVGFINDANKPVQYSLELASGRHGPSTSEKDR